MAEIELGNLYEMNKTLSSQMPTLNELEKAARWEKIKYWFEHSINHYAMLLCNEQRDYTLFNNTTHSAESYSELTSILFECLENRGQIVSIDPADGDAWEIWLRINNGIGQGDVFEDYCYFLFNYEEGVIEV